MQDHHVLTGTYYCGRLRPGGPLLVFTTGEYVVAEYNERSGTIKWQRVVQAAQRTKIEDWLNDRFGPNRASAKARPSTERPAQKSKAQTTS